MASLTIHPASEHLLQTYIRKPTQSLLLSGPVGIGTTTIARQLAVDLHARHDDIHVVSPDEKHTITIDQIRALYQLTRSVYDSPRVVVIDDAELMSLAAQNALLKLLEEPTEQTFFVLTSHQPQQLLDTIRSRTQVIQLRPVGADAARQILVSHNVPTGDIAKMLFIAPGLPAELIRLSSDAGYFQTQSDVVTMARSLLGASLYDRLVAIKDIKDRPKALGLVVMIGRLLEFSVLRHKRTDLAEALDLVETIITQLHANGNVKIQLTYLMTKLP